MKYIFNCFQKLISIVTGISYDFSLKLLVRSLVITLGVFAGFTIPAAAQIKEADNSATNKSENPTIVNRVDQTFTIEGGTTTNNNLFHNFATFGLETNQIADFKPSAGIQHIIGRVNGGTPSSIDGTIKVTGGDPAGVNLYSMNPAGILFGNKASLDINGAFTATTARAIGFGDKQWFTTFDTNTNYATLTGKPSDLAFTNTPGSIFNSAKLQNVKSGQNITLVGGTVISTGDIVTQGGKISIATVQGGKYVQISADGSILRLELPTEINQKITASNPTFIAPTLPELLTGKTTALLPIATGVTLDNGVVKLVGDNRSILPGNIITKTLETGGGDLSLNTQSGDIIVNGVDTSSSNGGGNITIDAGGLFRATGFVPASGANITTANSVSILTAGLNLTADEKLLRGGLINIKHQGTSFAVGGKVSDEPTETVISVILTPDFKFDPDASGTVGAIISRNTNSTVRVVLTDKGFINTDGTTAIGFGLTAVPRPLQPNPDDKTGTQVANQPSNPDQQASRPKSKENCTPSSTSVALNPTAAPTRSAGNANTISADPCQPNTSNSSILQILTDRE